MKKSIFIFLLTFMLSCSKDNTNKTPVEQLPPATQVGANTAGCYVNGELLLPKNGSQAIGGSPAFGLTTGAGINFHPPIIGDDYKYFKIANLRDIGGDDIYIHLNDMTLGVGNYTIGQSNGEYFVDGPNNPEIIAHVYDGVNLGKTFYSGSNAGTITITRFDYPNGIYSGIFNATLYNKDNISEKIQITDGRFDVNVATLNQ
jgi:hypothetical protein